MIAGDSKKWDIQASGKSPEYPKAGELNSKSNHFLSWSDHPMYRFRPGVENGITKIDFHLYPVRATSSFFFFLFLFS